MRFFRLSAALLLIGAALLTGCVAQPETELMHHYYAGEHGKARRFMQSKFPDGVIHIDNSASRDKPDRNYVLNYMRLALTTTADGYCTPDSPWDNVRGILEMQGVNRNAGAQSVMLNEDLKVWKGEPFEQAMARYYLAAHFAAQGSWDNAAAMGKASTFLLNAVITSNGHASVKSTQDVVENKNLKEISDKDIRRVESDFSLGYLITGLSLKQLSLQTGDPDLRRESDESFARAEKYRPELKGLIFELKTGRYNTVLFVDHGRGPQKIGTGMDQAIASFAPITPSNSAQLVVTDSSGTRRYAWACDLNEMSRNHMWNDLQDMRVAKSYVGTAMVAVGAGMVAGGAAHGGETGGYVALAGLLVAAAGAAAKAGAHADTRYCELIPQRVYVVPAMITQANPQIALQVEGAPDSRIVLQGLQPPKDKLAQLRYVRLVYNGYAAPAWALGGPIRYTNDYAPANGPVAPYVLGGTDVSLPTESAIAAYRKFPGLENLTLQDLLDIYREEGIKLDSRESRGFVRQHVLEGGDSLEAPLPGTAGFSRLFCGSHQAYHPRGNITKQWAAKCQAAKVVVVPPK